MSDKADKITDEELSTIKEARSRASYATVLAERAIAQAKTADLEVRNMVLVLCNKYGLDVNSDKDLIMEDGSIVRGSKNEQPPAPQPAPQSAKRKPRKK